MMFNFAADNFIFHNVYSFRKLINEIFNLIILYLVGKTMGDSRDSM